MENDTNLVRIYEEMRFNFISSGIILRNLASLFFGAFPKHKAAKHYF